MSVISDMQAKTANNYLTLNEITFTQKTNFLLDPLWSCGGGLPIRSRDKLLLLNSTQCCFRKTLKEEGSFRRWMGSLKLCNIDTCFLSFGRNVSDHWSLRPPTQTALRLSFPRNFLVYR